MVVAVRIEKLILGLTGACGTRPVASRVCRDRVLASHTREQIISVLIPGTIKPSWRNGSASPS